MTKPKKFCT